MRALDTNVIVRYFVADDESQFAASERVIEECRKNRESVFLSVIVLCELMWVLASTYRQPKPVLISVLEEILALDQFQIEYEELVRRCVALYRLGAGNFPDYLIGEISKHYGCRDVVTFDRALKKSSGFTVLV